MKVEIKYLEDAKIIGYDTPGDSVLVVAKLPEGQRGKYNLKCYKCGFICHLGNHTVKIVDGKVTLTPSVLCPIESCKEHYYIRNGLVVNI